MFRDAENTDLLALGELERTANLAALDHVFPAERYPFPTEDVLARWRIVLDDADTTVLVMDSPDGLGLSLFVAFDDHSLRHLAVHPDFWGKGLASEAVETAVHAMDQRGSTEAELWCLKDNHRAARLYHYLGWRPSDDVREAPWPPHPAEVRWTRLIVASER